MHGTSPGFFTAAELLADYDKSNILGRNGDVQCACCSVGGATARSRRRALVAGRGSTFNGPS